MKIRFAIAALALGMLTGGSVAVASPAKASAPANPLDDALARMASGRASLDDFQLDASWQLEHANRSVKIWGTGVGIWEKSVQFPMTREQILTVVNMLLDAKVGMMPQPGAKAAVPKAKAPLQLRGELTVIAGDVRTRRQQLTKGEQLEPLSQLVGRILAFSEKAAAGGVKASSLQDGLAKVGDGTLAPQAFTAFVRRAATEKAGESFLLRVEGRHVSDRLMPKGQLPPSPRELTLSDSDFRKLALLLRSDDPASMAPTTYAPTYTDVTVAVLDYNKNIPARPYLDVTAETHGEKQKAFDRMYTAFRELHERVQKEGKAVTPATGAPRPTPKPKTAAKPASPAKP